MASELLAPCMLPHKVYLVHGDKFDNAFPRYDLLCVGSFGPKYFFIRYPGIGRTSERKSKKTYPRNILYDPSPSKEIVNEKYGPF